MKTTTEFKEAENYFDANLSELIGNFNLTKNTHKDGTVVYSLSYLRVTDDGEVKPHQEDLWPRDEVVADEMVNAPFRPVNAYVRVGWFKDEDGKMHYSTKYLAVYDKDGKEYRPAGDKRAFMGSKPAEVNTEEESE